ncbi:MAG: ISKra4 family transposase [Planctomycetota bacterium]|jgi:hypothetical protein
MSRQECVEHIVAAVRGAVEGLLESSEAWPAEHWLYAAEQAARAAAMAVGRTMLQAVVADCGTGHAGQRITDTEGRPFTFKQYRTRTVQTLLGPVSVKRAVYQGPSGPLVPLDEALGLRGEYSEGVEEVIAFTVGQLTYEATRDLLAKTIGVRPSATKVQETAVTWGERAATEYGQQLPSEEPAARMAVAADGVMVRTAERRRKETGSRSQHFDEAWREAKLGAVYAFDRTGQANTQKRYVGSLEGKESFAKTLWARIEATGADRAPDVAWLGDGAAWIWTLKTEILPHAVEILDYRHARDHLHAVAGSVWGEGSRKARQWLNTQKKRLWTGRVDRLLKELRRLAGQLGPPPHDASDDDPRKVVASNVTYVQNNASRMRYDEYRRRGYPVGSGVVESACGHVVAQRMKITSRMSWQARRADAVLQLRCLIRSGQWNDFWPMCRLAA